MDPESKVAQCAETQVENTTITYTSTFGEFENQRKTFLTKHLEGYALR